jgi:hypothetical protein
MERIRREGLSRDGHAVPARLRKRSTIIHIQRPEKPPFNYTVDETGLSATVVQAS